MIKEIGIVIFDGVERLDVEGPLGVFGWSSQVSGGHAVNIRLLSKDGKEAHDHLFGWTIAAHDVIKHISALDLLIVPGGNLAQFPFHEDFDLIEQVKNLMPHCKLVASVCTGAFILAETGLADGKKMSTHQNFRNKFKTDIPQST